MSYRKHLMPSDISPSELFKAVEIGTDLAEVGMDCISRQAAIDGKIFIRRSNGVEIYDDYVVPVEYLEQLPPAQPSTGDCWGCNCPKMERLAQPERIKGHWIEHDDGLVACECSVCHEKYNLYEEDVFGRNFCPNCGAEMEVTT